MTSGSSSGKNRFAPPSILRTPRERGKVREDLIGKRSRASCGDHRQDRGWRLSSLSGKPCTKSAAGPAPRSTYAIRPNAVRANRLEAWNAAASIGGRSSFGTPNDVTLEELGIESSFPADEAT